jgi:hypothetical protein
VFRDVVRNERSAASWEQYQPLADVLRFAIACMQAVLLFTLYRSLEGNPPTGRRTWIVVGGGVAVMAGLSLLAPFVTSTDVYNYRLEGLLGTRAYTPTPATLRVAGTALTSTCMPTFFPVIYGPLFVAYAGIVAKLTPNVVAFIFVMRALGIVWLTITLATLRHLKIPQPALICLALSPVVGLEYITNAHNDLIAVGLTVLALALCARTRLGTAALIVVIGLVKLPLGILAWLSFAGARDRTKTALFLGGTLALTLIITLLTAGRGYVAGVAWWSAESWHLNGPLSSILRLALELICGAALLDAVFCGRYYASVSFALLGSGGIVIQPWYALWGIPYSLAEARNTARFLSALPLFAFLSAGTIDPLVRFGALTFLAAGGAMLLFATPPRPQRSPVLVAER